MTDFWVELFSVNKLCLDIKTLILLDECSVKRRLKWFRVFIDNFEQVQHNIHYNISEHTAAFFVTLDLSIEIIWWKLMSC